MERLNAYQSGIKRMKNLNELQLIDLPRLKHLWSNDPQQILSFKSLQLLKVHNCGNLTYIFNLSMASRLANLQHMEVKNCSSVEHIIAKAEDEKMQEYQTVFPSLPSIKLQHLTNLLSVFNPKSGFIELPSLKTVEVIECPNMELFAPTFPKVEDTWMGTFLGNKNAVPKLEELKVEWNNLKDKLNGNNHPEFLSRLKSIELTGFQGEEYAIMPSNFLQNFAKLETLVVADSLSEEINIDELSYDPLVTNLRLSNLPKLKCFVKLVPLFQTLEDLEVVECSRLTILVPSSVSFRNLSNLEVLKCDELKNLMTASTATSLVQLRRMSVKDCKMMEEIVAIASDGVPYEIQFSQLEYLGLENLPCLKNFCSGNYAFHFPSLKEVMVIGCPNMKIFAEQVPTASKVTKIRTGKHEYEWEWEGSFNNTIQALFMEKRKTKESVTRDGMEP